MKSYINKVLAAALPAFISFFFVTSGPVHAQKIVDNVYHLTDQDFSQFTKSGVVLVDFWATWCGPCRIQAPIIDEIALEIGAKAIIAKVNVDAARVTATRYNVQYTPTIIIFRNGKPASRFTGVQDKETLVNAINELAE